MKRNIVSKTVLVVSCVAAGAALLSSRAVEAGLVTHISGTICKPAAKVDRSSIAYENYSAANSSTSSTKAVICGLPMKYSIGKTLQYDFNVVDNSAAESVRCQVFALNTSNTVIFASPEAPSTTAGFNRMTVTSPEFANEDATQRHYAVCMIPKAASGLSRSSVLGIRLY